MAVAISLPVSVSPAAVVQALTLEQLAAEATLICTCRMSGQRSDWDVKRSMLVTYVALSVEELYKGEGEGAVEVELFSGFGHEQLNLFSGAVFEQGEQAVLFLKLSGGSTASAPRYHLVGWAQGKFTVRSDPKTGEEWIERNLRGIPLSAPEVAEELDALRTPAALRTAIRTAVSGAGSPAAP